MGPTDGDSDHLKSAGGLHRYALFGAYLALLLAVCMPRITEAACNIIPGVALNFRGALGSLDRPFAAPGAFVTLRLRSSCDAASSGLAPTADGNVVSIVFTPPNGAPDRNSVVVLADDCAALSTEADICGSERVDVGYVRCIDQLDGAGLELVGLCQGGPNDGRPCVSLDECSSGTCRIDGLRFRFPDTDPDLPPGGDAVTLSGPARIAVTRAGQAVPCALASDPCSEQTGLVACLDEIYSSETGCDTTPHPFFPGFTALPFPNSYSEICHDPAPPCDPTAPHVRFTTDAEGNMLIPMSWHGVLVGQGVPIARLLRGSSAFPAFSDDPAPIVVPGNEFLRSFSPEGGLLPPVFDPQADPTAVNEVTLFGSADAPATVLRVERRTAVHTACLGGPNSGLPCYTDVNCGDGGSCGPAMCSGGVNDGTTCVLDSECPDAECGSGLFDFSDRYEAERGPVLIPRISAGVCQTGPNAGGSCTGNGDCAGDICVGYRLTAEDPVPLEGLSQTQQLFAFVVPESVQQRDLNGDGDTTDDVALLVDRDTGQVQRIGTDGSKGLAVVRLHQPPFSYPVLGADGDVIAFLESEPGQNNTDLNGDADVADGILRVLRIGVGETVLQTPRALDASPKIDGRPLSISGGLIFARTSERAMAARANQLGNAYDGTMIPSLRCPNGPFVYLSEDATQVICGGDADLDNMSGEFEFPVEFYVHDMVSLDTERVTARHDGGRLNPDAFLAVGGWSADARYVVSQSDDPDSLPPGVDTNGVSDIILRDRCKLNHLPIPGCTPANERVSVGFGGAESNGASTDASMSADGRYVAFVSAASNLLAMPTTGEQIYVRDLCVSNGSPVPGCTPANEVVSVSNEGAISTGIDLNVLQITRDGTKIFFRSRFDGSLPGSPSEIYVRDRIAGTTSPLQTDLSGVVLFNVSWFHGCSDDARYVALGSFMSYVPQDRNDRPDVYVFDRVTNSLELASSASDGAASNGVSYGTLETYAETNGVWFHQVPLVPGSISGDGRRVAFESSATNLVPDSFSLNQYNIYIKDLDTGVLELVNRATDGAVGNGFAGAPAISREGTTAAFLDLSSNLIDGVSGRNAIVHAVDPADPLGIDSLLFGDGSLDDVVLEIIDPATGDVTTLCPAGQTVTADGTTAFLRPETSTGTASCPGNSLNGDGDVDDQVVHWWSRGAGVNNLGCAATAVAMQDSYVAALVSEAGEGFTSLNGDGDTNDTIVKVASVAGALPTTCDAWQNTGQAADTVAVCGSLVALITPEASQGTDLNGDSDLDDRVLQLWNPATQSLVTPLISMAAEELVCNRSLLAFRSREANGPPGACDLNGDGDCGDDVLFVYDLAAGDLRNTGQAVTPCQLEACDPRLPYRVLNHSVRFLTYEADQGEDLDRDGDAADLVVQSFNVRVAQATVPASAARGAATYRRFGGLTLRGGRTASEAPEGVVFGAISTGVCTTTGEACAIDAACGGGSCFVPPGGCLLDLGSPCSPTSPGTCTGDAFCFPTGANAGTCRQLEGPCLDDSSCTAPAQCYQGGQQFQRLVDPLSAEGGGAVFTGTGECVEEVAPLQLCVIDADCSPGERCGSLESCERVHGACVTNSDCSSESSCRPSLVIATCRDMDADEVCDPLDNCPIVSNPDQADQDFDGVGDVCDPEVFSDADQDGVPDGQDNCPADPNPDQADQDSDGIGDACDSASAYAMSGHSLRVKDRVPGKRSLTVQSRQVPPWPDLGTSPTESGGEISMFNPLTAETDTYSLPAQGWERLGRAPQLIGFKYTDKLQANGPCKTVIIKLGKTFKAKCFGEQMSFTLDEPQQGALAVQGRFGGTSICLRFGGTVVRDEPGRFDARTAPAPASCP